MKSSGSLKKETALNVLLTILVLFAVSKLVGANFFRFAVNTDHSLPQKLFLVNLRDKNPVRNGYVVFSFKGSRYYKKGHLMVKQVTCLPGDVLTVKGKEYFCNGKHMATARDTDSKGIPVENFKFSGKIPAGNYFVLGTSEDSYDSRYWGFVERKSILGVAHPLF